MSIRKEESHASESSSEGDFAGRLRNYSRMVSEKLDLNRQSAAKVVGMSAAACAALSAHQSAEAAIRYSGPLNLNAAVYTNFSFQNASFNIDGLANFGISAARFSAYYLYGLQQVGFGTTGTVNNTNAAGPNGEEIVFAPGPNGDNQPDRLGAGTTIDSNSPWFAPAINAGNINKAVIQANNYAPYSYFSGNNWPNPAAGFNYPNYGYGYFYTATGFAGIRFDTAGGNAKHNGWVRLQITNNGTVGGFTQRYQVGRIDVLEWAYETTPDAPIEAGAGVGAGDFDADGDVDIADLALWQRDDGSAAGLEEWQVNLGRVDTPVPAISSVPEPGSAALLTLGLLATGARGVRRQRKIKEAK